MIRLLKFALFACFLLSGAAFAAPVGYFHQLSGAVFMTPLGKPEVQAKQGDVFDTGTAIRTADDGKAILKFEDGQIVILAPKTKFAVTQYTYLKDAPQKSNILFGVTAGALRFVTGLIGHSNPSGWALKTPTMTAGVRGTTGDVIIKDGSGDTVTICVDGSITVTNASGTVTISAGSGNSIAFTPAIPPGAATQTMTTATASTTPAVQALLQIGNTLIEQGLGAPNNLPVQVQDAADAVKNVQSGAAPPTGTNTPGPVTSGAGGGGGAVTSCTVGTNCP